MFGKVKEYIFKNWTILFLIGFSIGVFILGTKINLFRYNNFDLGKFDLGNMTQMVWNTINGSFMYLTDYFGTNLPRWAMSHVDPILLLVVPFFLFVQSPLTLIFFQLTLLVFSSILIYLIAELEFENKVLAMLMGLAYLMYPAMGFLMAWTAFHGVTVAVPFFLGAFYVFERMYKNNDFSKRNLITFWILLVITMSGKEELPLFVIMLGLFILFFRNGKFSNVKAFLSTQVGKLSTKMIGVGIIWFITAFFIIIPAFSHFRSEGYESFAENLGIDTNLARDVAKDNYFLSRYEGLGDSYSEVILNMIFRPGKLIGVLFNGDKVENMRMTFDPLLYAPFLYPPLLIIALPELLINYAITGGGIGTSEIFNHRISMIVPVLFLATIYGINYISVLISQHTKAKKFFVAFILTFSVMVSNLSLSYEYGNPIYLWLTQAVQKRVTFLAHARTIFDADKEVLGRDLELGERFKLAEFERRDRECARDVIDFIPDGASVSGPDYMGSHLSMRETYAIFPALYNSADYVIVDVFALKVVELLDLEQDIINDVVGRILKHPEYQLRAACGNLFIFENIGEHGKSELLPIQESFVYEARVDLEIFLELFLVDFEIPELITRGEKFENKFTYNRRGSTSLNEYVVFTTYVNKKTGEVHQLPNLPSFAISQPKDWARDRFYSETNEVHFPEFVDPGDYMTFVGISNNIRTRSIYLGDVEVR
ncbi:DUF2079 domain-containing protein [candidate division WWE3 bacterium]|jgi:uncharacterized membrane protein|nr:DUF2079 domain-containing protein [candidate division WWE3 bacterium]MBT7349479.1 DUF2079 domain-containing protein [candidate division WWE3 bacterium]